MMLSPRRPSPALLLLLPLVACGRDSGTLDVTSWAGGCYALESGRRWLTAEEGGYAFSAREPEDAVPFRMQPTDLGMYLLYDGGKYLAAEGGRAVRADALRSDVTELDDHYISAGEWVLEGAADGEHYRLTSRRSGQWLARDGTLTDVARKAADISLANAEGCATFPELTLDAMGTIQKTMFADGTLYGIADSHSHLLSNLSFGGGGIFHGAPFHRYGVEHALPDCSASHGAGGRRDFFGFAYDAGQDADLVPVFAELFAGELSEDNHATAGYPDFTEWPDARQRTTHQAQYYRWLERAWLGGLRLIVQHATNDASICNLMVGEGIQPARYDCDDMTAVDRIIDAVYEMERYIDAQHGGAGAGWFRIVTSPAEARAVVAEGKLAVILGIETSNLFRCYLTPRPGDPTCDAAYIDAQLDAYYDRGVRALFPVHKYSNRFSPGDGSSGFIELGELINSGHWTNKSEACPPADWSLPTMYDGQNLTFASLNEPREEFLAEAPNDLSGFPEAPLDTLSPYFGRIVGGGQDGTWCQNATITPLGEHLLAGMMARGMVVEVDHFPQWAYTRAYEILEENNYPAAGTHHRHWEGRIFTLGGISSFVPSRCQDPTEPGASTAPIAARAALIEENGGYPGIPFSFDFNGFASAPGPRFGEDGCGEDQPRRLTYPFSSYAGDIEFTAPSVGNRVVDFNTEGMIHIGLLPELIQDFRADAADEAELEPLFRGAEAYIRMWERAEARAEDLRSGR